MKPRLQAGLNSGAENPQRLILASQRARHGGSHGGGSIIGEVPLIVEQRQRLAGFRGTQHHHAAAGGKSFVAVRGKRPSHLQNEIFAAAPVAGLHVDLRVALRAVGIAKRQMHRHRHIALPARVGDQRLAHQCDYFRNHFLRIEHRFELRLANHLHARKILSITFIPTFPPVSTITVGESSVTLPASTAATAAAEDGSIRYWWLASIQRTASSISLSVKCAIADTFLASISKGRRPSPPSMPPADVSAAGSRMHAAPRSSDSCNPGDS